MDELFSLGDTVVRRGKSRQNCGRVDRPAVLVDLEVKMGASGPAGHTDRTQDLVFSELFALNDPDFFHMGITGL